MILAALDGTDTDDDVTETACHIAIASKSKMTLIFIIEIPREYPVDVELHQLTIRGEETLQKMEKLSRKLKVKATGLIFQARSKGTGVVAYSREQNANVLVLGIPNKSPYASFSINRDVNYVLTNADCRVVTCRSSLVR
jgi:nucleotide-binding universal stress UspA family protein